MTETEYDNGLSDYEWHEEVEREKIFFCFFEKTKTGASEGQNKEQVSQDVQLICS